MARSGARVGAGFAFRPGVRDARPAWYEPWVLPNELLEVLVCPQSKQPLIYFPRGEADRDEAEAFLLCPESRLRYAIQDGVPVMLVDEAVAVPPATVEALVARARELGLRPLSPT